MANEKLFHVGVKALIRNSEGKYLVVYTSGKDFTVPGPLHGDIIGGRIEDGQTPEDALRREIEEEASITEVEDIRFLTAAVSSKIQIKISDTQMVGLVLMVYSVSIPEDAKIVLSDEHTKFEWLDKETAADALEYKFGEDFSSWLRTAGAGDR